MSEAFGFTRTRVTPRYALLTRDGLVPGHVPGWKNALAFVQVSPAMTGPRFTQLLVKLAVDGTGEGNTGANQYFLYLLVGAGRITIADKQHRLEPDSYVYLPPGSDMQFKSTAADTKLLIFQKPYQSLPGLKPSGARVGHIRDVRGQPLPGNDDVRLQSLLPDQPEFDIAVDIFTFQPGATLPLARIHTAEQGVLMLKGQGIHRLDSDWHPAKAGDAIWLASHCPHWFATICKSPASYICCQNANRDPR